MAACEATLASTSRSSFWNRCRWSLVSTWITPSDEPSLSTSGAHITERIRKSAMLWLVSNRESLAASADSTASCVSITWLTIVRLIRTWSSMSARRCLIALGTSAPSGTAQDHEPAVGLDENLEQAVQQLAEHFVEADGLAEVVGDLDHGPQLDFGIDGQPHAGVAGAADFELRNDGRSGHRRVVIDDQEGGPVAVGPRQVVAGLVEVEGQRQIADFQAVAVFERLAP